VPTLQCSGQVVAFVYGAMDRSDPALIFCSATIDPGPRWRRAWSLSAGNTVAETADRSIYHFGILLYVALSLKNPEVERLAAEVARLAGESKTEAVRRALAERRQRLIYRRSSDQPARRVRAFLEREVWPEVPVGERGKRLTRAEEDEILGFHHVHGQ
jgi:antitoxin VapB